MTITRKKWLGQALCTTDKDEVPTIEMANKYVKNVEIGESFVMGEHEY